MELLFILIFAPFILMIIGVVMMFSKDPLKKKKGRNLILIGVGLLGVEILIGYSICSNMSFGGGH